jgi:hypothetical protein
MVYRTRLKEGELQLHDHDELQWVEAERLEEYALAEPDQLIAKKLQNESARNKSGVPNDQGRGNER